MIWSMRIQLLLRSPNKWLQFHHILAQSQPRLQWYNVLSKQASHSKKQPIKQKKKVTIHYFQTYPSSPPKRYDIYSTMYATDHNCAKHERKAFKVIKTLENCWRMTPKEWSPERRTNETYVMFSVVEESRTLDKT